MPRGFFIAAVLAVLCLAATSCATGSGRAPGDAGPGPFPEDFRTLANNAARERYGDGYGYRNAIILPPSEAVVRLDGTMSRAWVGRMHFSLHTPEAKGRVRHCYAVVDGRVAAFVRAGEAGWCPENAE